MFEFVKNIGPTELIVLGLIVMLLFGRKVLVGIAHSAGETLKELKKIKSGFTEVIEDAQKPVDKESS